ncbi:MAG: hypothetical protein JSS07_12660 [Proteobacteria bacterium]|nr:hypothetical protein [Pseudomonadota bacterium]
MFHEEKGFYTSVDTLLAGEAGGVALLSGRKVTACVRGVLTVQVVEIDPILKRLTLDDGSSVFYKKCLLATGLLWCCVIVL